MSRIRATQEELTTLVTLVGPYHRFLVARHSETVMNVNNENLTVNNDTKIMIWERITSQFQDRHERFLELPTQHFKDMWNTLKNSLRRSLRNGVPLRPIDELVRGFVGEDPQVRGLRVRDTEQRHSGVEASQNSNLTFLSSRDFESAGFEASDNSNFENPDSSNSRNRRPNSVPNSSQHENSQNPPPQPLPELPPQTSDPRPRQSVPRHRGPLNSETAKRLDLDQCYSAQLVNMTKVATLLHDRDLMVDHNADNSITYRKRRADEEWSFTAPSPFTRFR